MEHINSINIERIAWCCADYGITPAELAARTDISDTVMDRLMSGGKGLTFIQLSQVASFFGRGVLFFMEEGPVVEAEVYTAQFRTIANQKPELSPNIKQLIERVEKQRDVYLSLLEDLDELDQQQFNPPALPGNDLKLAAGIVREWLGLTERNTFDTYRKAVASKGTLVFRSNGYMGKWQIPKTSPIIGFTIYDDTCPVIVIKKLQVQTRECFTLMHELGHLLLHRTSSIDDEQSIYSVLTNERDANAFAGYLLVPDPFLASIRDEARPISVMEYDSWLEPQRKAWHVSAEVILRRLMDEGRLPQADYTAYREWRATIVMQEDEGGNRSYRHREPIHIFGDGFVRTVLDALNTRHITLARASSHLDNLSIKDLHQLERLYEGA